MAHDHAHQGTRYNRAFAVGIGLNVGFVVVEFVYGALVNSLALIADAGHNLSDVLSLVLAWGAFFVAERRPSPSFTYGLRKATILAALLSAILLLVALGAIAWEAIHRFGEPRPVGGTTVLVVAGIGVVVNTATAWLFFADRKDDLNIKGAYLHMAADAAVSLGVVVAGALIILTGWNWLDPATSLAIASVILIGTWGLLRDSVRLSVDAAPKEVDLPAIETWLRGQPGVQDLHDLHVWALSTTQTALTVHLVVRDELTTVDSGSLAEELLSRFGVQHTTIQTETDTVECSSRCATERAAPE